MRDVNKIILDFYLGMEWDPNMKKEIINTFIGKNHEAFFRQSIYGLALAFHLKDGGKDHKDKSDFLREINSTMITAIDYKVKPDYCGTVN